jgi:hypothetical protein
MCNDYRLEVETAKIFEDFADLKIKIRFSEGAPNIQAREDIKITDTAPIVRMIDGEPNAGDLVQRRWSWPGQNGRPVYNFRSDGREFNTGRCLIIADGFYEFTDPADKQKKRKGQVALHQEGRALVLYRGHLAGQQRCRRGLHDVDDGAGAGHCAVPRSANRHPGPRRLGGLARSFSFGEIIDQASAGRLASRPAD